MKGSVRDRWLPRVPGLVLAAVALHQIALAQTAQLNPWKGGGFGMFATTDHGSARLVRAWLEAGAAGEPERLAIPFDLEAHALHVRQLPQRPRVEALAQALFEAQAQGPQRSDGRPGAVRVEVVRVRIDLDRGRREEEILATARWPRASETVRRVE